MVSKRRKISGFPSMRKFCQCLLTVRTFLKDFKSEMNSLPGFSSTESFSPVVQEFLLSVYFCLAQDVSLKLQFKIRLSIYSSIISFLHWKFPAIRVTKLLLNALISRLSSSEMNLRCMGTHNTILIYIYYIVLQRVPQKATMRFLGIMVRVSENI